MLESITLIWTPGHTGSGIRGNEHADKAAKLNSLNYEVPSL